MARREALNSTGRVTSWNSTAVAKAQMPIWINVWFQLRITPRKISGIPRWLAIFTTGTRADLILIGT